MDLLWFGTIAAEIVHKCIQESIQRCPGCEDMKISPLLHLHIRSSLEQKLEQYMPSVIPKIDLIRLARNFADEHNVDEEHLIYHGQSFLSTCTPKSILFGGYITTENDVIIYGVKIG